MRSFSLKNILITNLYSETEFVARTFFAATVGLTHHFLFLIEITFTTYMFILASSWRQDMFDSKRYLTSDIYLFNITKVPNLLENISYI